jgi:hypothetical protein
VYADEKLAAFLELESAIRVAPGVKLPAMKPFRGEALMSRHHWQEPRRPPLPLESI